MAFSSSPAVGELQRGVGFAFRPIQSALGDVGRGVTSIFTARSPRWTSCAAANQAARARRTSGYATRTHAPTEVQRQNDRSRPCCSCAAGLAFKTVAARVVARESSEFRRVVTLDHGSDDGIREGDVVIAAGGAPGRSRHGRRAQLRPRAPHERHRVDGRRAGRDRAPRQARLSASWAACSSCRTSTRLSARRSATRW